MAQTELNKLDAFHRKQLRKVLNIYYPTKISNKTLYKKCNEKPLSTHILESRWSLFGYILRRNEEIPANKAMQLYFHRTEKRFRGRPTTTLPVIINKDLSQIQDNISLKSTDDLKHHWHRTVINGSHSPSKFWRLLRRPDLTTRTRKANKSDSHIEFQRIALM